MKKLPLLCFIALFIFPGETLSPTTNMNVDMSLTSKEEHASVILDVPMIQQLPELYNGCEVTSLAMLLADVGRPVDKLQLAERVKKDPTPYQGNSLTDIEQWGDPNEGFVGDITGEQKGYSVYHRPIYDLLAEYVAYPLDGTGQEFTALEALLDQGNPVVVWVAASFKPTDQWVTWKKGQKEIMATFRQHAVLLVGYDNEHVYVNDPLTGEKAGKKDKDLFIRSWTQLGKQAVSVSNSN